MRAFRYGSQAISERDFEAALALPELRSFQVQTLDTARRVLVHGEPPAKVAKEEGVTRAAVYGIAKRVMKAIDDATKDAEPDTELVAVRIPSGKREELERFVESIGGKF